ncbi:GNAT family N-acetyltransferase [Natrarchaeobius sp. A-rgal3]|uniref:GNAT family N-acetyltransferase n=1 Tax=Natrarchaeobius versutus TaxID=1679078 RepID=UPI00350F3836
MNVRAYTPEWESDWNEFCVECDEAWFLHTRDCIDYYLAHSPETVVDEVSFLITSAKEIQAICPLSLTETPTGRELSLGQSYAVRPAIVNESDRGIRKTLQKKIFERIDTLADEHDVSRTRMMFSPLSPSERESTRTHNYLQRFGYTDTSVNTRIIDLGKPRQRLWDEMRKGHRRNVSDAESDLTVTVFDQNSITRRDFATYEYLHYKAAGRRTRSERTFQIMYDWVKDGYGILVRAEYDDTVAGTAYFNVFGNGATYSSGANDPAVDLPVGHVIHWHVIKWLKEHDYEYYESGIQWPRGQVLVQPSQKQRDISYFKRGFGGFDVPLFRGVRYYDSDRASEDGSEKVEQFASQSFPP